MEKQINAKNLASFCYVNDKICKKPIRGIVVEFNGLGGTDMHWEETGTGRYYAERGILFVNPYTNPWAWMNPQAVDFTDEIIDVLCEMHGLPDTVPVVSTGGSMGGLACLVYAKYAKRTPVGCVANCPVCDLPFHYTERPDLPRSIYSAFRYVDGTLEDALKTASPLHLADSMPDIPYVIFHCEEDKSVNIAAHSEKFVDAMRGFGKNVTFIRVPGRGHCDLPHEQWQRFCAFAARAIPET